MKKQQKSLYAGFVVLVVAILAIWYFSTHKKESTTSSSANSGTQQGNKPSTSLSASDAKVWTGTLKVSDNSKKGNYMLVTSDRNIYFQSRRDFSALVGKEVKLEYSGDLSGFTVLSVTAK